MNSTRYVILGLLTEGPMSGYDIKKIVDIRFRYFWSESYGQIYPELRKLTGEGLVVALPPEPGEGGRPRKVYTVTRSGRTVFSEWMKIPPEGEKQRFEILLKVYWAPSIEPDRIAGYIQEFSIRHRKDLEILRRMETEVSGIIDSHANHWWVLQTIKLGIRVNEVYVAWAAGVIEGYGDIGEMKGGRDESQI